MTRRRAVLLGQTFGQLTVVGDAEKRGSNYYWPCQCTCGHYTVVQTSNLLSGRTLSCGCFQKKCRYKHGQAVRSGTPTHRREYDVWNKLKRRCRDPGYPNYHKRVSVCARWLESFNNFFEDMGPMPSVAHTIERADNNGNYCPENCVWATRREQARNRRTNHRVTFNGRTLIISDWAALLGLRYNTLWGRLHNGWSVKRALTTPLGKRRASN